MNYSNYKQRLARQLNMPYGTACNKLRLKVIFDLLCELKKNKCSECDDLIDSPENLSVAHDQPWVDIDPFLFWKTTNIVFRHRICPDKTQQVQEMNIVSVNVLNEQGEKINTYSHEGKIWIPGQDGERYDIEIKNNSSDRIEIVASVDGRDVISGEIGDYKSQSGYVINPWGSYTIKGFRQSNDRVAAFRFTTQSESYSSKMGTPQNVGIIGIAVFREKHYQISWRSSHQITRGVEEGWRGITGDVTYSSTVSPTSSVLRNSTRCQTSRDVSELGTKYGESMQSKVINTHFVRETPTQPNEIHIVRYDSESGLERRGINLHQQGPDAFPGACVAPGFAQPPPEQKNS